MLRRTKNTISALLSSSIASYCSIKRLALEYLFSLIIAQLLNVIGIKTDKIKPI